MIYLATPYSDPDPEVREYRFREVNKAAAKLIEQQHFVFSPISHTHPIAKEGNLPRDWAYWEEYDKRMIRVCSRFMVLRLPGYTESIGVIAERRIALELGRSIEFMEPVKEKSE